MIEKELLAVARGDRPADRLFRNARLVDVLAGEIREAHVAVARGRIAGFGARDAREEIDLEGRYLAPGLIDAHVHIESSLVVPSQFARAVVPRGVTTVITDPHEIANVLGLPGIRFMLRDGAGVPLEIFANASSCVPASPLETSGASLDAEDLRSLLDEPRILGLAEVMSFPAVVAGDDGVLAKLEAFTGRIVDGHCPGLSGPALDAYVAAGIGSDHECIRLEEAREKLRRGMTVFLREATNARNLEELLPLVDERSERRLCLCTDDRTPADLMDEGSIDHLLRKSLAAGVDPVIAFRLATLNPAEYFRLPDRGAVAPGRRADLVTFSDLRDPRIEEVYLAGSLVAEGGDPLFSVSPETDETVRGTVEVDPETLDLSLPARGEGGRIRVIGIVPDQILTEELHLSPTVEDGEIVADPDRDLLRIAVVERHRGSGRVGRGMVRGFGLRRGAVAGTVAHDHHNLIVIGADEESMRTANRAVVETGGGLSVARDGEILARLPLPVAGLMSDRPVEEVRREMDRLLSAVRDLGSSLRDPFMAMSFLGLEVIPSLKITDRGLVDADRFEIVPLRVGASS
ncbi:MAG: adenine deaminase [Thermoanaerobaculia bacterium]|nr:adenine deaminase [Thermoanaerobaculia bacterium]